MDRDWIVSLGIRLLLILLIPFSVTIRDDGFAIDSVLIHIGTTPFVPAITPTMIWYFIPFFLFFLAPSILFNYTQYHAPREKRLTKHFLATFIFGHPFIQYLLVSMLFPIFGGVYQMDIMNAAMFAVLAAVMGFLFLAVISFFVREMNMYRMKSQNSESISKIRYIGNVSSHSLIIAFISLSIYLIPTAFFGISYGIYPSGNNYLLLSGCLLVQWSNLSGYLNIMSMTAGGIAYPFYSITTGLYLFFVLNIIRYVRGEVSRMRCMLIGLGALVSSSFTASLFTMMYTTNIGFPLPFVFIIGILILFKIDQDTTVHQIWDDAEAMSQWYDSDKGNEEQQEKVKVPLTYALRSKLMRSTDSRIKYDWDHKEEDVFKEDK